MIFIIGNVNLKNTSLLRWPLIPMLILLLAFSTACGTNKAQGIDTVAGVTVRILDVGQGDSILIQTPEQVTLIDTGDVPAKEKLVAMLKKLGITTIDQVIITHPHADHLGGMGDIMENFTVKKIYDSGQTANTAMYRNYLTQVKKKNIPFQVVAAGDRDIDIGGGAVLKIMNPPKPYISGTSSDLNNNSIVLKLVDKDVSMLLTGDAEKEAEEAMLNVGANALKSTLLKVGHHGSSSSTSPRFLQAVAPEAAFICVGANNDYHHPHPSTLKKFENLSKQNKLFRTDLNGTITIQIDGKTYKIEKEK